jgi:hypothetical protein
MKPLALVPVFLLLAGCAANSYCKGEQGYQKAASVPPLKPTAEGLKLPESPSSLRIPPPPANPVPYGETVKDADGDDMTMCLDRPPEMASNEPPAQPVAPPPAPKPVEVQPPPEAVPAEPAPAPKPVVKKKKKAAATPAPTPG